jgi:uncharacterized protein (TIGR02588 family)
MFNSKKLIVMVTLFLLLAATIIAAENGKARFAATRTIFAAGTELKAGQYDVKWEANGQETTVLFTPVGTRTEIKVQGKVEQSEKKYDYNSMVTGKDSAGRDAVKELQFKGNNVRIVFE